MAQPLPTSVAAVQIVQALVARELVEGLGLPERRASDLLGIVPSSVSQYLSGKRLGPVLSTYLGHRGAREIARRTADRLISGAGAPRVLLEAAIELEEVLGGSTARPSGDAAPGLSVELQRKIPNWLRHRIAGEQNAVAECMRLAQRSRDELTRALFRQIASDSLRHAEIVASLAAYLDRGVTSSAPTGIDRTDVEALIQREHEAEASNEIDLGRELGGMLRILWESMESDELKHERLLELLLRDGLAAPPPPAEGDRGALSTPTNPPAARAKRRRGIRSRS